MIHEMRSEVRYLTQVYVYIWTLLYGDTVGSRLGWVDLDLVVTCGEARRSMDYKIQVGEAGGVPTETII